MLSTLRRLQATYPEVFHPRGPAAIGHALRLARTEGLALARDALTEAAVHLDDWWQLSGRDMERRLGLSTSPRRAFINRPNMHLTSELCTCEPDCTCEDDPPEEFVDLRELG